MKQKDKRRIAVMVTEGELRAFNSKTKAEGTSGQAILYPVVRAYLSVSDTQTEVPVLKNSLETSAYCPSQYPGSHRHLLEIMQHGEPEDQRLIAEILANYAKRALREYGGEIKGTVAVPEESSGSAGEAS